MEFRRELVQVRRRGVGDLDTDGRQRGRDVGLREPREARLVELDEHEVAEQPRRRRQFRLPAQVIFLTVTTVSWNACWPEIGSAAMGSTWFWAQPLPRFLTHFVGSPPDSSSHHMLRSQSGSR